MEIPKCCGREMSSVFETSKFMETHCSSCGDVVYVKKENVQKPQLIDD